MKSSHLFNNKFYLSNILDNDLSIKYDEIVNYISSFNQYLVSLNIKAQKKILLIAENSNQTAMIIISLLANNRICIPVNPKSSIDEIKYIINDSKVSNVFVETKYKYKLKKIKFKNKILINSKFSKKLIRLKKNLKFSSIKKNDIAEIVYTSGSTGKPKGVVLTHDNVISQIQSIHKSFKFKKHENFLTITPLFHNSGQFFTTFVPLMSGGNVYTIKPELAFVNFFNYIKEKKINWSLGMGAHINFFINQKKINKKNSMKGILVGGMRLEKKNQIKFEKRFNFPILKTYGLTETCSFATVDSIKKSKRSYGGSGVPISANQIKIFDIQRNKSLNKFKIGEIRIKGRNIFSSYLNKKKMTKDKFINGWFCSGDLGYFDNKKNLFIEDRIDNMIIVSGENVYPSEIEKHLLNLKHIQEGYIVGKKHKIKGNEICLVFKSKNNIEQKQIEIWKEYLSSKISNYKIPTRFLKIGDLNLKDFPRLANGKINKLELIKIINK